MNKQFVITGPESTGKSTLTLLLAKKYNASWVKEYAREYLEQLNRNYEYNDVIEMAKKQLNLEKRTVLNYPLVFLDTDLTVFHVWIQEKYNREINWIKTHLNASQHKVYFLCDIDIPWQPDALREHPRIEDRERLFKAYKNLLEKHNLTYHVISGDISSRLKKCQEIIDTTL